MSRTSAARRALTATGRAYRDAFLILQGEGLESALFYPPKIRLEDFEAAASTCLVPTGSCRESCGWRVVLVPQENDVQSPLQDILDSLGSDVSLQNIRWRRALE